jgi:hypothetical protein
MMKVRSIWRAMLLLAALMATARFAPAAGGLDPERNVWRPLLQGTAGAGWAHAGAGGFKRGTDAMITDGGPGLFWYTKQQFSNCQIRVIYKPTRTNDDSGVFVRLPTAPTNAWDAIHNGHEVQLNDHGYLWGRTGCLNTLTRAKVSVFSNVGEWNELLITLFGPRTRVHVNGVLITDYAEGDPAPLKRVPEDSVRGTRPAAGYIGLQNHDTNSVVHFREVSVRML